MEGDYNEDLCVLGARLVSQCREPKSLLPISIFHSCFGERKLACRGSGGGSVSALRRADHRARRLRAGPETVRKVWKRVAPGGAGAGPHLLEPGFVSPPSPPLRLPAPSLLESGCILATSLALLVTGNAPFPLGPCTLLCPPPPGQRRVLALYDPAAAECQVR